jgi:hypothetical protein
MIYGIYLVVNVPEALIRREELRLGYESFLGTRLTVSPIKRHWMETTPSLSESSRCHLLTNSPIIMIPPSPDLHKAHDVVDLDPLPHPASALLRDYILEAVQPQAAADYVQRRLSAEGHANGLIADWIYVIYSG